MTARAAVLVDFPPDFALQQFIQEGGWQLSQFGLVGESPSIQYDFRIRPALAMRESQWIKREVEGAVAEEGVAGVGWWPLGCWGVAEG